MSGIAKGGARGIDRRGLLTSVAAMAGAGQAFAQGGSTPAAGAGAKPVTALKELKKEADFACLYHCDFGDPKRFAQMMTNMANHYSAYGNDPFALQLAIVAHGAGLKFFLSQLDATPWKGDAESPALFSSVSALFPFGLRIYLCHITFERMKLDTALARPEKEVLITPSGVATVGDLQSKGYAYLKVG